MEFKSIEKWRVQKNFSLSEKQLDLAIKRMMKRHPYESWVINRIARNGKEVCYLKMEFVNWLSEVYFNKEFYLDTEIKFFEKQIERLEEELKIPHKNFIEEEMTVRELCGFFDKNIDTIYKSIERLKLKTDAEIKYLSDGKIVVSKEGVEWLYKNYFRKAYLFNLEMYKLELQKHKRKIYGKSKS